VVQRCKTLPLDSVSNVVDLRQWRNSEK
jgi:hypothetical protein